MPRRGVVFVVQRVEFDEVACPPPDPVWVDKTGTQGKSWTVQHVRITELGYVVIVWVCPVYVPFAEWK